MILTILGICVVIFILGCVLVSLFDGDLGGFTMAVGVVGFIIALIATICLGISVKNHSIIDERIAMYEDENSRIEEQISTVVEEYMEFENKVFTNVTPDSAITLVSLYPELKSDTLVASLIDVYIENNNTIKHLREQQISGSVIKWWLYFGG